MLYAFWVSLVLEFNELKAVTFSFIIFALLLVYSTFYGFRPPREFFSVYYVSKGHQYNSPSVHSESAVCRIAVSFPTVPCFSVWAVLWEDCFQRRASGNSGTWYHSDDSSGAAIACKEMTDFSSSLGMSCLTNDK